MQQLLDDLAAKGPQPSRGPQLVKMENLAVGRAAYPRRTPERYLWVFFSKMDLPDERGCLNWLGAHLPFGHGQICILRNCLVTSRVAWMIEHGPIPKGLCVCHKCDNGRCCNPQHLFLGTHSDNMKDCAAKGRNFCPGKDRFGERNNKSKLTDAKVRDILFLSKCHSNAELARRFGVTRQNIRFIKNRVTWKHIK